MNKNFLRRITMALALGLALTTLYAAEGPLPVVTGTGQTAAGQNLEWWREARFGLFIHWGSASLIGQELSWSRGGARRGLEGPLAWPGFAGEVPPEVYDNLYRVFNPTRFNAKEWVALAQAAGMKYIVFTARHHDGFSMFDSQLTDYKVTNSPCARDVAAELALACHEAGMKFGFYYSQVNWSHPAWNGAHLDRYLEYMHGQIRELCTRYGKLDIFWFDGACGTAETWQSEKMLKMIRELQPGILINDRSGLPGDFQTPEQTVGYYNDRQPWETCMTIGEHWGWTWEESVKSADELLTFLIYSAAGDGNFLLNLGPRPTGEFEPEQAARIRVLGQWLGRYGESIYGTRGGPYKPALNVASTRRGNTIYVHVLDWMGGDTLVLNPIERRVVGSSLLSGGRVSVKQTADGVRLRVAKRDQQKLDTVVKLELDGPADSLAPRLAARSGSLAFNQAATATSRLNNDPAYGADKAFDDNSETYWNGGAADKDGRWQLEVDLGRPQKIDHAFLAEWCLYYNCYTVLDFELQYQGEGGDWQTFHHGKTIGRKLKLDFAPLTARRVRLVVLKNEPAYQTNPGLFEFQLFAPRR